MSEIFQCINPLFFHFLFPQELANSVYLVMEVSVSFSFLNLLSLPPSLFLFFKLILSRLACVISDVFCWQPHLWGFVNLICSSGLAECGCREQPGDFSSCCSQKVVQAQAEAVGHWTSGIRWVPQGSVCCRQRECSGHRLPAEPLNVSLPLQFSLGVLLTFVNGV